MSGYPHNYGFRPRASIGIVYLASRDARRRSPANRCGTVRGWKSAAGVPQSVIRLQMQVMEGMSLPIGRQADGAVLTVLTEPVALYKVQGKAGRDVWKELISVRTPVSRDPGTGLLFFYVIVCSTRARRLAMAAAMGYWVGACL